MTDWTVLAAFALGALSALAGALLAYPRIKQPPEIYRRPSSTAPLPPAQRIPAAAHMLRTGTLPPDKNPPPADRPVGRWRSGALGAGPTPDGSTEGP